MEPRRTRELAGPKPPERITRLSNLQLVKEIVSQVTLLAKRQIELAKAEIRADVRAEAKVAGGLGLAAVGAIIVATLLLVTGALALSLVLPAWAAGLIVTGVVAIAVALVAFLSWRRRVRTPLQHSRDELKQDVRFARERFA
jgi:uncharacterized membrane protein YqjE